MIITSGKGRDQQEMTTGIFWEDGDVLYLDRVCITWVHHLLKLYN